MSAVHFECLRCANPIRVSSQTLVRNDTRIFGFQLNPGTRISYFFFSAAGSSFFGTVNAS